VLGEMAELGSGAEAFHEEIGRVAAELGIAELIAVGPLARSYTRSSGRWVATAEEAAEALAEVVRPGDVVLVKGSRSVGLEAVAAKLGS
jgi:UDP-N-acetylmuramoyl-tripeptide--D-alanyl-D-alanine ligase